MIRQGQLCLVDLTTLKERPVVPKEVRGRLSRPVFSWDGSAILVRQDQHNERAGIFGSGAPSPVITTVLRVDLATSHASFVATEKSGELLWIGWLGREPREEPAAVWTSAEKVELRTSTEVIHLWAGASAGPLLTLGDGCLLFYDAGAWCIQGPPSRGAAGGVAKDESTTRKWVGVPPPLGPTAASPDGAELVWSLPTGGLFRGKPGSVGERIQALESVTAMAFSPDGNQLAVVCHRTGADNSPRCELELFDVTPGQHGLH